RGRPPSGRPRPRSAAGSSWGRELRESLEHASALVLMDGEIPIGFGSYRCGRLAPGDCEVLGGLERGEPRLDLGPIDLEVELHAPGPVADPVGLMVHAVPGDEQLRTVGQGERV